ncbi:hypothetical protein HYV80_01870 [Candidatus Woesearchaeota archaeon]|nr:hypothetical protein [Candidatus Woesearchaeota archaeon]
MTYAKLSKELWKDRKLLTGFILVLLSIIIGFYGKIISIAKFYEPIGLITGLSIWAFSWVLLFIGIFMVGWETVKLMHQRIHHHVKKTAKDTYEYTKKLPKKGYHYTRKLHKKSMDKLAKTSKAIAENIKND